jgi:hypothetical protein
VTNCNNIILDDDSANIAPILTFPSHFTIQHISPRLEEVADKELDPRNVLIELLATIPSNLSSFIIRCPMTPQTRKHATTIEVRDGSIMVLTSKSSTTVEVKWQLALGKKLEALLIDSIKRLNLESIPLHATSIRKHLQKLDLVLLERLVQNEGVLEVGCITHGCFLMRDQYSDF